MAMSRKHYTEIAEILKRELTAIDTFTKSYTEGERAAARLTVSAISLDLASFFKRDNSAFDRDRFLTACGF